VCEGPKECVLHDFLSILAVLGQVLRQTGGSNCAAASLTFFNDAEARCAAELTGGKSCFRNAPIQNA
jgi:hypothetical protein